MGKLKFAMLTDLHYYSKKNWIDTDPYKYPARTDNVYIRGSEEIVKYTFEKLKTDESIKYVFVGGDITQLAERTSHEEVIKLLRDLKSNGKKVYTITATHDFMQSGFGVGYDKDNNEVPVPAVKRESLAQMYSEFGIDEAIAYDEETMCYVAQLEDGYRLLALNDDMGDAQCGFTDRCFDWICEQIKKANDDGQFLIAMTHHPIIPHSPLYPLIAPKDMIEKYAERVDSFAKAGLHLIFTGHTHSHNISCVKTSDGTPFYAVSTAALTGYPPAYRIVECDAEKKTADIKTVWLKEDCGLDLQGKTLPDYIKNVFLGFVDKFMDSCLNDYDRFVYMANNEFSTDKELLQKLKKPIKAVFGFVNGLTYGKLWKIARKESGLTKEELEKIKDEKVLPVAVNALATLFDGKPHYSPYDSEYKVISAVFGIIDSLIKPFSFEIKKLTGESSLSELVLPLLCQNGVDHAEALISLDEIIPKKEFHPVKSNKGAISRAVLIGAGITVAYAAVLRKK